jgi:hypothetical protein
MRWKLTLEKLKSGNYITRKLKMKLKVALLGILGRRPKEFLRKKEV